MPARGGWGMWLGAGLVVLAGLLLRGCRAPAASRTPAAPVLAPEAYVRWAQALATQGAPDAAQAVLAQGVRAHPHDAEVWRAYALTLDRAHRWAAAWAAWQQVARLAPTDPQARYEVALHQAAAEPTAARPALQQAATGPYAVAARRVLRAVEDGLAVGHTTYARVQVGRALAAVGRWDLATWSWALAVRQQPTYAPAWAYLGEGYHRLGWDAAARGAWRYARALAPHDPLPALLQARAAQQHGRPFTALAWYRRAWAAAPGQPALAAGLAVALTQAWPGHTPEAVALLTYPTRQHPQDADAWLTLARLALQWNLLPDPALPALRRALALNPDHPQALALMGHAYARLGDLDTAQQFLLRALRRDPGLAEAHLYLAWVYVDLGQVAAAQEHLAWAQRLAPADDPVHLLARRTAQRLAVSP